MKKFFLSVLIFSTVLLVQAQQGKIKAISTSTPTQTRVLKPAPKTLVIVPAGENAPESIIRIVSAKKIALGKYRVNVAGGPCRNQSKTRLIYNIDTKEAIAKDDLFFLVPVSSAADGFALRRASSHEAAQYAKCQWSNN